MTSNNSLITSYTQTEVVNLNSCESCSFSMESVKVFIYKIENCVKVFKLPSEIELKRSKIKESVLNYSQWGAMRTWIKAITQDLETLIKYFQKLSHTYLGVKSNLEKMTSNYQKLSEEYQILKKLKHEDDLKYELQLKTEDENRAKCYEVIQNLNQKITILEVQNASQIGKINEYELLKELRQNDEVKYELQLKTENENRVQLEEIIQRLNQKIDELESHKSSLQEKLENSEKEKMGLKFLYEDMIEKLKIETGAKPKISGNPLEDMKNQLNENAQQIELLMNKNNSLQNLIEKLNSLRSTKDCITNYSN